MSSRHSRSPPSERKEDPAQADDVAAPSLGEREDPPQANDVATSSLGVTTSKATGRTSDAENTATRETIKELNEVIQAASDKYSIPQENLVRAFMKDRDQQMRQDSVWNVFQKMFAYRNKMKGDTKVYTREEGEIFFCSLPVFLCSF
jgi:hypothetical protein